MIALPEYSYLILNTDLVIRRVECHAANTLHWTSDSMIGRPVTDLFDEEVQAHIRLQINVLFDDEQESSVCLIDPANPDPLLNSVPFHSRHRLLRLKWKVWYNRDEDQVFCLVQDVTKEFQRIYSAFSTHQYNESIVEQVTDGIIMFDVEGRVVSANQAALRSLDLTWLQLTKRALIHPAWHIVKENKDRHPGFDKLIHQVLRERVDRPAEIIGIFHPNKRTYHWFNLHVLVHRNLGGFIQGAGLVLKDITDRFSMYERVRLDKQEIMHLAHQMYEGIWVSSYGMQKTVFINEAFRKSLGLSAGSSRHSIRNRLIDAVLPAYRDKLLHWFDSVSKEKPYAELTAPFEREDGSISWFKTSMFEHQSLVPDNTTQRVVLLRDVTDEMQLVESLDQARKTSEALSTLKSNIIANISHEFRTPLSAIIGFSTLAGEILPADTVRNFIQPISESAERLAQTLTLIADFSLLEAGSMGLFPRPFSPKGTLETVISDYQSWCEQSGIAFTYSVTEQCEAVTDSMGVLRITNELIRNAVKFTDSGKIHLELHVDSEQLFIRVTDTGEGINSNLIDQVFEPFRQLSEGISRKHEGIGLGMAVVKRQVNLMQGSISIEQNQPAGTSVTVVLPHLTGVYTYEDDQ